MNGLRVLRQLLNPSPDLVNGLRGDSNLYEFDDHTMWVDNDHIWDAEIARLIHQASGMFMLVDADFNRLYGPVRSLDKVESARAGAKIQIVSLVEDIEDEADELAAAASA